MNHMLTDRNGEQSLKQAAERIEVPFNTLQAYRGVASTYEKSNRLDISWSHHQTIAANPDRLEWLAKAAAVTTTNVPFLSVLVGELPMGNRCHPWVTVNNCSRTPTLGREVIGVVGVNTYE